MIQNHLGFHDIFPWPSNIILKNKNVSGITHCCRKFCNIKAALMQVLHGNIYKRTFYSSVAIPVTIYVCHYMKQELLPLQQTPQFFWILPSFLFKRKKNCYPFILCAKKYFKNKPDYSRAIRYIVFLHLLYQLCHEVYVVHNTAMIYWIIRFVN